MARKTTPPLLTRGRYQLKAPWQAAPDKIYVCMAVRSFEDVVERGHNVFESFYEPLGLTQSDYQNDERARANIVTLMAEDDSPVIYVPDTYIISYPNMNNVTYSHMVLSVSMGALPDYLDLDYLRQGISNLVSDVIGATPEVHLHKAPSAGAVTPDQHETLEAARLANVKMRETDYARLQQAQTTIDDLQQKINTLEQIIISNGLMD